MAPDTAATDSLCGCRIERDEDGDYAFCRWCVGHGIRDGGEPCFHCNGKGVHYPNEVTVDA